MKYTVEIRWTHLWDKAIGQWNVDDAGNEARAAEQEEVPVETARFGQRKVSGLGSHAALILYKSESVA